MNIDVKTPFVEQGFNKLVDFRSKNDNYGVKFTVSLAGVGLTIAGLIESIISIALSLFTLPGRIFDNDLADRFYQRADRSFTITMLSASLLQYYNLFGSLQDFQTEH